MKVLKNLSIFALRMIAVNSALFQLTSLNLFIFCLDDRFDTINMKHNEGETGSIAIDFTIIDPIKVVYNIHRNNKYMDLSTENGSQLTIKLLDSCIQHEFYDQGDFVMYGEADIQVDEPHFGEVEGLFHCLCTLNVKYAFVSAVYVVSNDL